MSDRLILTRVSRKKGEVRRRHIYEGDNEQQVLEFLADKMGVEIEEKQPRVTDGGDTNGT